MARNGKSARDGRTTRSHRPLRRMSGAMPLASGKEEAVVASSGQARRQSRTKSRAALAPSKSPLLWHKPDGDEHFWVAPWRGAWACLTKVEKCWRYAIIDYRLNPVTFGVEGTKFAAMVAVENFRRGM